MLRSKVQRISELSRSTPPAGSHVARSVPEGDYTLWLNDDGVETAVAEVSVCGKSVFHDAFSCFGC